MYLTVLFCGCNRGKCTKYETCVKLTDFIFCAFHAIVHHFFKSIPYISSVDSPPGRGGGGCPDNFLVINVHVFSQGLTDLAREAIGPEGPIASRGVAVPVFLGKPIATCDFPGKVRTHCPLPPPPLDTRSY